MGKADFDNQSSQRDRTSHKWWLITVLVFIVLVAAGLFLMLSTK